MTGLTSDASSNLILNQISPPDKRSSDDYEISKASKFEKF